MTWTYSGNPGASTLDQVRFLLGDTNTTRQLFSDEEITWTLTVQTAPYLAAADLAELQASRAGGVRSKTVGDLSVTYDSAFWSDLARNLRRRNAMQGGVAVFAGGISRDDKSTREDEVDRVPPLFNRDLHEVAPIEPPPSPEREVALS